VKKPAAKAAAPALPGAARRAAPKGGRDRLMAMAARLFREVGYASTSTRDIAKLAGVERSALYHHFPSKEALLEAVLDASIVSVRAQVGAALETLPAGASPRTRFSVAIAAHIRAIRIHGDYALASRRVMGQIPQAIRRKHDALRASYGAYWQELLEQVAASEPLRPRSSPGLARMFLLGAINWTSEWFDPKKKSPEALAEILCANFFDGLVEPRTQVAKRGQAR
jgi:AcrR family transcriptional regulator